MDTNVPYVLSSNHIPKILEKMQHAGVPEVFNRDFLKDLGFTGSGDRPFIKVLKYLGFLDSAGRPQSPYREYTDHTRAKVVLASRLRLAFDDLFTSDRQANTKQVSALKGWFKSKTGASDSVAEKVASTFKALAQCADFSAPDAIPSLPTAADAEAPPATTDRPLLSVSDTSRFGFVYRIEIHLPDTQNVETFRAIFRALREELMP